MKIVVVGAGAIGGYVGGRLAQQGHEVVLLGRGAHLAEMQAHGLKLVLDGRVDYLPEIRAVGNAAEAGPAELVLFTVKLPDTHDAARNLPQILTGETRIVTLQNGIDGKQMLGRHAGAARIAVGTIFIGAFIRAPGVIEALPGMNTLAVDAMKGDPVIAQFVDAVNATGALTATATDDPTRLIWSKFVPLAAFSGITGLTRLPLGRLREDPEKATFYRQLIDEGLAVAEALGIRLGPEVAGHAMRLFDTQPPEQKSSMLLDLEAGKGTEVEYLSGRLHRLGLELGVPTPGHTAVWVALSAHRDGPPAPIG